MNCFEILGIEPTENERDIKKAYASLLKIYHPEEHPEKFKEIHNAYMNALQFVKVTKNIIIEEVQDIGVDESLNSQINQEDVFEKLNDIENNYKLFNEKSKKDNVNKIYQSEVQKNLREITELYKKELQEQLISKDKKHEELENKFKFLTDYEKKKIEKEKQISILLAKLDRRPIDFNYLNNSVFNSSMFQKYSKDPLFIKEYIEMIDNGFYDSVYFDDKILFKKFHEKVFFSNSEAREKNKKLYESLYPFLYFDKRKIIENIIFISLMFITFILGIENNVIFIALVVEFIVFLLFSKMRSVKHRCVKMIRKLTIIVFSVCVFLSSICYFYVPSRSFGNYKGQICSVNSQFLKQTSEGVIYGIQDDEGDIYIKTSQKSYKIEHLKSNLQDFGFYRDNLYYISEKNVFMYGRKKPVMGTNDQIYEREITYNEGICLLMEETIDGIVNVYQLKNEEVIKIYSYNGFLSLLSSCKYYYLVGEKLYYTSRETNYLMCYNIDNRKVEETSYSLTGVYSIGGIEDDLFFGGDYPHFEYNTYEFKGRVTTFVNLDNQKFAYINESDMLYIVNYALEEEIARIDLYKEYEMRQYDINSIAGNGNSIALIYGKYKRLEIYLK